MENEDFKKIEKKLKTLSVISPNLSWVSKLRSSLLERSDLKRKSNLKFAPIIKFASAGAFILVFLVSGTVLYSQNSLPGDLLYPIKRSYESVRLALTSDEDKFEEQQKLADRRIEELKKVVMEREERSPDPAIKEVQVSVNEIKAEVTSIRKEYRSLTEAGKDTTVVKKTLLSIVPVLEENQEDLDQIEETLPEPQQPQLKQVKTVLEDLQQQIEKDLNPTPDDDVEGIDDQSVEPQNLQPSMKP